MHLDIQNVTVDCRFTPSWGLLLFFCWHMCHHRQSGCILVHWLVGMLLCWPQCWHDQLTERFNMQKCGRAHKDAKKICEIPQETLIWPGCNMKEHFKLQRELYIETLTKHKSSKTSSETLIVAINYMWHCNCSCLKYASILFVFVRNWSVCHRCDRPSGGGIVMCFWRYPVFSSHSMIFTYNNKSIPCIS